MTKRAKKREPALAGNGLGWLYPQQPCGLPYTKFRAGHTFKDAHDWIAFRANEQGQTFRPTQKRIVNQLARMKRSAFAQYEEACAAYEAGTAPPAKSWADCDRVCKVKSKPCGRACISKKRNCKKLPPAARTCSIEEFQRSLPFEQIARDEAAELAADEQRLADYEDHRRIFGTGREDRNADTSFDFGPFAGLGRLSPAQKQVYAARRLVSPAEALERIRERHGAAAPSLERLPSHIKPFARFMAESSAAEVTPRKVAKAYVITRSSVRRKGRKMATMCETFPGYRELRRAAYERGEEVRPEDAMSVLLTTPDGKAYLDALDDGRYAARPAERLMRKMRCFGLTASLLTDLEAAVGVAHNAEVRGALRSATPAAWVALVDTKAVPGIGPAKAGFFASLLGRGDVPTFDAREIDLWRRHEKEGWLPAQADVHALRERLAEFPLALTRAQEPFRQHLAHHALWDAFAQGAPTSTTHEEVIDTMRFAGLAAARGGRAPADPAAFWRDVRAVEAARAKIIAAVESGAFELCPKGQATPAERTFARPRAEHEAIYGPMAARERAANEERARAALARDQSRPRLTR